MARGKEPVNQRISVALPDSLHALAKVVAVAREMTLAEYLRAAIEEEVSRREAELRRSLGEGLP
ncbi:hypothetical protein J4439_02515 [Candidatus Woesearchaeota archaeon]|nr:hypothetical protein [Candidatus Woesearchaeota archaeon]